MPNPSSGLPPAGWYVDNFDALLWRWWDGSGWTEYTRRVGDPPVAAIDRVGDPIVSTADVAWSASLSPTALAEGRAELRRMP